MTDEEIVIPYRRRTRQIEIGIVSDDRTIGQSIENIRRQLRIRLEIDRQRFGSESALGVVDRQEPQSTTTRILRPRMSFALVLLPQELDDSFVGWLGIIALEGIESLEIEKGEKLGVGRSAKDT